MIVLGLGSSGGDALSWLRKAVAGLAPLVRITAVSPVYESDAMLPEGAPASWDIPYLNLAVACELRSSSADSSFDSDSTSPLALLSNVKRLEKALGRKERERWAPREIDIDILDWEGVRLNSSELSIPHPGLLKRPFALLPLTDVAPGLAGQLGQLDPLLAHWRNPDSLNVPFRTRKSALCLTELVAILNVTPDSFSDGGAFQLDSETLLESQVLERARRAQAAGATVLDLGAESTRPGATPVPPELEWQRLKPALKALREVRAQTGIRLSLDSRSPETVERALNSGPLDWINDVGGFSDPRMRELARDSGADLIFMHSLGVPPDRAVTLTTDRDPISSILDWARTRIDDLEGAGIARRRLIFDPGIGFGKTPAQNLAILRWARRFHELGVRILIGHSRKSFLGALGLEGPRDRDLETALLSTRLADLGIEYLRIHDVQSQARALKLSAAWDGTSRW
jgi:2-amino-4-hydroxy-6-hydroxymethyldihydropteridine diphosphokinase/dihydropteroate synthase